MFRLSPASEPARLPPGCHERQHMSSQVAVIDARDDSETGSAACWTGEAAIRYVLIAVLHRDGVCLPLLPHLINHRNSIAFFRRHAAVSRVTENAGRNITERAGTSQRIQFRTRRPQTAC